MTSTGDVNSRRLMYYRPVLFLVPYLTISLVFAAGLWDVFPEYGGVPENVAFVLFCLIVIVVLSTLNCLSKL